MELQRNSPVPLYSQLYSLLEKKIREKTDIRHSKLPSIRWMINAYKVSMPTVRKALEMLEKEGLIYSVPKKGYFAKTEQLLNTVRQSSDIKFAAVFSRRYGRDFEKLDRDPIFSKFVYYLGLELKKHGYHLIQTYLEDDMGSDLSSIGDILSRVDGIIFPIADDPEMIEKLQKIKPTVLVLPIIKKQGVDIVTIDRKKAFYDAVAHLLKNGFKDIYLVDGIKSSHCHQDRIKGYARAYNEWGLPVDKSRFIITNGWTVKAVGEKLASLGHDNRRKAYVTANDTLALGVEKYMNTQGALIPEDVSIFGAKNTSIATCATPELSSIDFKDKELVKEAVSLLLKRIRGDCFSWRRVSIDGTLVLRRSTVNIVTDDYE